MTTLTITEPTTSTAAPWMGRRWEHRQAAIAGIGSLLICTLYWAGTKRFAPDYIPGWVEFTGTTTSLWAVWITQKRNVLAQPIGIISVLFMGYFFSTIGLVGQQWLQWGFYLPVQFLAWHQWTRGGKDATELPVTFLKPKNRAISVMAVVIATIVLGWALNAGWDNALYTYWDASIVGASIVAQMLLTRKKAEAWVFWILPVNVSAIGLYLNTGANMFAALYMAFLVMAFFGGWRWVKAARKGEA